jgi:hypothetical protein
MCATLGLMKHRYVLPHILAAIAISILYACTYELPVADNSQSATSSSSVIASSSATSSSGQGGAGSGSGGNQVASSSSSIASSSGVGGAGGSMVFPSVHCGDQGDCFAPLACCTDQKETFSCGAVDDCTANQELAIECDGPEDCPGQICCGRWNDVPFQYEGVYCALKCLMPFVAICHFDEPDPYCPEPYKCFAEPILGPRYGYCGTP